MNNKLIFLLESPKKIHILENLDVELMVILKLSMSVAKLVSWTGLIHFAIGASGGPL
jgi:hypothetical protein